MKDIAKTIVIGVFVLAAIWMIAPYAADVFRPRTTYTSYQQPQPQTVQMFGDGVIVTPIPELPPVMQLLPTAVPVLPPTMQPVITSPTMLPMATHQAAPEPAPIDYDATRQSEQFAYAVATSEAQQMHVVATSQAMAVEEAATAAAESPLWTDELKLSEGIRVNNAARDAGDADAYQLSNGMYVSKAFAEYLTNCATKMARGQRVGQMCPSNSAALLPVGR